MADRTLTRCVEMKAFRTKVALTTTDLRTGPMKCVHRRVQTKCVLRVIPARLAHRMSEVCLIRRRRTRARPGRCLVRQAHRPTGRVLRTRSITNSIRNLLTKQTIVNWPVADSTLASFLNLRELLRVAFFCKGALVCRSTTERALRKRAAKNVPRPAVQVLECARAKIFSATIFADSSARKAG